jgi:ankyrin repeat protein
LHDASKFGHEEVVKILVENGADVKIKNKKGQDPIALAVEHNKQPVVAILRAKL